jgi:cytochrome b6-f complex iron-sulfur subunit
LTAVEPTTSRPDLKSRRKVLCGLAVALLAPGALVAACSDDSGSSPVTENGDSGGSGNLAALTDVPDGGGLVVESPDEQILLVRTGEQVKAYNAACTHQGTIVEAPVDGIATCPNHGSQFTMEDGSAVKGPATSPLAEVAVRVEQGQIVLA